MKTALVFVLMAGCFIRSAGLALADDYAGNPTDKRFVREFYNLNLEIERIGQLAQTQSTDSQVQALGHKLYLDYSQAGQQISSTAQAVGVTDIYEMRPSALREVNKLAGLSGQTFDQAALHQLFKCQESCVRQMDLETSHGEILPLRQWAALIEAALEADLWQTTQLSAQFNGHP